MEEAIELAKQQLGLDDHEVRHWQGWYRHSSEEHTYHAGHGCPGVLDRGQSGRANKGAQIPEQEAAQLRPLTVPEVRRLLWRLVWQAPATPEGVLYWSHWRRRRQARAKHFHIKRRTARFAA